MDVPFDTLISLSDFTVARIEQFPAGSIVFPFSQNDGPYFIATDASGADRRIYRSGNDYYYSAASNLGLGLGTADFELRVDLSSSRPLAPTDDVRRGALLAKGDDLCFGATPNEGTVSTFWFVIKPGGLKNLSGERIAFGVWKALFICGDKEFVLWEHPIQK